jgi:1A family penicillin-binding protein
MLQLRFFRKARNKNKKRSLIGYFFKFLGFGFLILVIGFLFLFIYYAKDLPRPEKFTERTLNQSTKIYDRSGQILLYEIYGEEKRTWVPLSKIPEHLKQAVIAVEDVDFYKHFGIDFGSIFRSILINLKIGKPIYGGSTLTQQLIRSTFLNIEKTPERKFREIILSLELERRYSKDQILEWYLNQIPLGQNAYGVEAASQTYFQKSVSEISIPEAATLAALIKAPTFLSPYGENKEELLKRKNLVLDRMVSAGFLTKDRAEDLKKEEIQFVKIKHPIKAPHFSLWVKDYLIEKYGEDFLMQKGLKVYTSLDWELQKSAEKIVADVSQKNVAFRAYNASLVAINPKTGEVLAMVGSKDFFADPYPKGCTAGKNCLFEPYPNVALRPRQPGSAFKPFVYVTAFQKGYNDKTVVVDEPTCWPGGNELWCPQNYDGLFRGPVTLRQALAQSLNIPSVKVLDSLAGLNDSIKNAQKFGITTLTDPTRYGLAIVLGGAEVKLLDMVSAYGVFATEGFKVEPLAVLKIEDSDGNIIEENKRTPKRVIEREPVLLINDILSDNNARAPIFGPRSPMYFEGRQVSAKTGTTQDFKDGWIIGYTSSIVVGVWVGNNDNTPLAREPGIIVAGPIWRAFMEKVLVDGD